MQDASCDGCAVASSAQVRPHLLGDILDGDSHGGLGAQDLLPRDPAGRGHQIQPVREHIAGQLRVPPPHQQLHGGHRVYNLRAEGASLLQLQEQPRRGLLLETSAFTYAPQIREYLPPLRQLSHLAGRR